MKKNTLLYLDRILVEKAKKANLNISKLAEQKIREELNLQEQGKDAYFMGLLDSIQFTRYAAKKVESIRIHHYGEPKAKNVTFSKRMNLIIGPNASGKTRLLNALRALQEPIKKPQLIAIDDILCKMNRKEMEDFLIWLKKEHKNKQIIITGLPGRKIPEKMFDKIIRLP